MTPQEKTVSTPQGIHRVMHANRRRDTRPELALRRALFALGWRYRVDLRLVYGDKAARPDITFTRLKVAVFVDGCFWHGCPEHYRPSSAHAQFWSAKLAQNRQRDARDTDVLESEGWTVVRIWEHEPLSEAVAAVEYALGKERSVRAP